MGKSILVICAIAYVIIDKYFRVYVVKNLVEGLSIFSVGFYKIPVKIIVTGISAETRRKESI